MNELRETMELSKQNGISGAQIAAGGILGKLLATLRSIKFARRPRVLRVRESLPLGERRHLLLVEWESRSYLLGSTPQGITLLDHQTRCKRPDEAEG